MPRSVSTFEVFSQTRRSSFRHLSLIIVAIIATPGWGADDDERQQDLLASFRIARFGEVIRVPVTIADREYPFVLDTGADVHMFDKSLRPLLGDSIGTVEVNTGSSPITAEKFKLPAAAIGPLPLVSSRPVICLDLAAAREALGEDIYGIVGIDFFRERVVQIDFDAGVLRVFRPQERQPSWGTPLCLKNTPRGIACTEGTRIGKLQDLVFIVDTGRNGGLTLAKHVFRHCMENDELQVIRTNLVTTLAGQQKERLGRLSSFGLGPFDHRALYVSESLDSMIGLGYLSRYIVTLDVSGRVMYLRPGKRFHERDRTNLSGLQLKVKKDFIVTRVYRGSPAEQAGLRKGDVVLTVNGRPAKELRLAGIRRLVYGEGGDSLVIKVRRSGKQRTVTLELHEWWDADKKEGAGKRDRSKHE